MRPIRNPNIPPENYLMYKYHERQDNLQRLKKEQDEKIIGECNNFMPKINKKSK